MSKQRAEILLFLLLTGHGQGTQAIRFNRKLTGVEFNPYINEKIKFNPLKASPNPGYTVENVKTMLEVVSTKFSRIIVSGVDAPRAIFNANLTYYHNAGVKARTAEMAAYINRERRNLTLRVMLGVAHYPWWDGNERETDVTLEASQVAQSIFPGTVEGLFIYTWRSLAYVDTRLKLMRDLKTLREKSSSLDVRVGIRLYNSESSLGGTVLRSDSIEIWKHKRKLLANSDFIICHIKPAENEIIFKKQGTMVNFNSTHSRILELRNNIKSIDNHVEVMWYTRWEEQLGDGLQIDVTKHLHDLRDFWQHIDMFATQHNYVVWIEGAIGDYGWWKLSQKDLMNDPSGYQEYVSTLPNAFESIASTHTKESRQTSWKPVAIIMGVIFVVTLLSGVAHTVYRYRSSSRFRILTKQEIEEFSLGILDSVHPETNNVNFVSETVLGKPYDRGLEIPKEKLEILTNQLLGGGEFGCVFKALLKNQFDERMEVALKTTKPNAAATAIKAFLMEIKVLTYLGQHPNIVPILGAYTADIHKGTIYIATELCHMGSLKSCLKAQAKALHQDPVQYNVLIRWSYEVACGMEYLEQKGVIHADLATRNVLLTSESIAKITDFGLSRRLYEYKNYTRTSVGPFPWRWMAFETLKSMEFSTKSDVWSYGITLWEIFSLGAQPYPGQVWTSDFIETLEDGFRPKQPKFANTEIFEVMEKCWKLEKDERPSFSDLKNSTGEIHAKAVESLYTKLDVCGYSEDNNATNKTVCPG